VLYAQNALDLQLGLRRNAKKVSVRYLPQNILPKWLTFLHKIKQ